MTNQQFDERESERRKRDDDVRRLAERDEREKDLEEAWRRKHPIESDDERDRAGKRRRA